MDTFDTINKATIVNSKGEKYLDFRASLSPRYAKTWFDIMAAYASLGVILIAVGYMQMSHPACFWLTIPLGGAAIGYIAAALNLFIHEASHYHLAPDKKQNDLLANIFLGLLIGMDVHYYRTVHFAHHRLLGTAADTEKSYFDPLSWQYVLGSISGVRLLRVIAHRNISVKKIQGTDEGAKIVATNNKLFILAVALNLCILICFFVSGYWQVALAWIVGLGAAFPFFATFRQILEHRSIGASAAVDYHIVDHGVVHRMFGDGPIASTLGAAGFNRHLLHHWDPQVPYTRLRDVEQFLKDTCLSEEQEHTQTTYFKTFIMLIYGQRKNTGKV